MRALSVAARAAAAAGVIVLGASCRPDRLTAPGADATPGVTGPELGAAWGSNQIDVKPDVDTLPLGATRQLTVNIGDARQVKAAIVWTSLDPSIATVDRTGRMTAVGGGTALIVGKVGPSTDTALVVVPVSVAAVSVSPRAGELTVGQQSQLSASTTDALGRPIAGTGVTWTSINPEVATVASSGVVTGVSTGEAKIVANAAQFSDTATVRISAVPVAAVSVAPTSLALSTGASAQLTAAASSASGAPLAGRLTTWTSSDASVATVSPAGVVTGIGAGTATIAATIDGKKATAEVKVTSAAVASLTVSPNTSSLVVGQTTQVSAVVKDAAGTTLSGRAVTWASSDEAVATISSSGVVSAVAAGSVTISGTSEGVKGSVTLTVSAATVARVTVSLNSANVAVGQTTQATAAALDASGQPISGRTVTWSIDPSSIATVSTGGVVTGVAAGSATLTATVDGKSASTAVTVTAPVVVPPTPGGSQPAVLPELPRYTVASSVSSTPSAGASIRVPAGGDLQAAIVSAKPGDVILLAPGASYTGNFVLPVKSGASDGAWVTIRTDGAIGSEGTRVTPSAAGSYAKILTPNAMPAIATDLGAHHYRIMGVEVAASPAAGMVYSLIALGDATVAQNTLAKTAHHFVLDRVYAHGRSSLGMRRCLALNSAWTAVVDSWLGECHSNDGDSQAIWGSNGPGPFTIVNNYLEGAGENVMFGGDDSRAAELLPADITLKRNHIVKPASWKGVWSAKNLFELKVGRRVLLEANVLEGSWLDAQIGFAIVVKSVNQEGGAPWSQTTDITIRYNRIVRSLGGFSISGRPESNPVASTTARVLIEQNLLEPLGNPTLGVMGRIFQLGDAPENVILRHNTGFGTEAAFIFAGQTTTGFMFRDNVVSGNSYNWSFSSADGHGVGSEALDYHAPGWKVDGNVFVSGGVAVRPPSNSFVATMGEVGFVNAGGPLWSSFTPGDYRLTASSPYKGKATDGTDPGVNHDALATALAGVTR